MKTRTAPVGSPLRQERYASSPCFEQGLLANHVARRCALINPPEKRAAIWFVQWRSWQPGGLDLLAKELLRNYPISDFGYVVRHPDLNIGPEMFSSQLIEELTTLSLDPMHCLFGLYETVNDYRQKWIKEQAKGVVQTEIGKLVASAMTYASEARTMVLIDGAARIGKTFEARQFCQQSGGLVRYVQVPSASDMASFIRAIGEGLGLATNLNLKVQVLHDRIRDALASEDVSICFDEAHYLWPMGRLRYSVPSRVNWIMTTLCNMRVPVILVSTPQFYTAQAQLEKQTAWTSEQFIGRLGHVERLPDKLSDADLRKVAAYILPGADTRTIAALAAYATVSKKHLSSIDAIAKRAEWFARHDGRDNASADDVKRAMKESVIPSDAALAKSLAEAPQAAPRARRGGFAAHPRPRGGITLKTFSRSSAPALELVKT